MIDNKKEQERAELHRTIWGIANDLRGSVDGWDFKNYVLVMLFYRYISENLTSYINAGEIEAGTPDFDYTKLSDEDAETAREDMVQTKGFFILPSQLFVMCCKEPMLTRTSMKRLRAYSAALRDRRRAVRARTISKGCSMISM